MSDGGVSLSERCVHSSDAEGVFLDWGGEGEAFLVGRWTVLVFHFLLLLVVGGAASNEGSMT